MDITLPEPIYAGELSQAELVGAARRTLREHHLARISGYRATATQFIAFVSEFGYPLTYYGDTAGSHPDHQAIHRVRYEHDGSERGELHASDGPLTVHSAQSLRDPRPPYFCMYMVDAGWQDRAFGLNGESILTRWEKVFELIGVSHPHEFEQLRAAVTAEIPFPDGVSRALAYPLPDQAGPNDLGIRLKYDLLDYLRGLDADSPGYRAVSLVAETAPLAAWHGQLRSGDLVLIDNDRWGHGRHEVSGRRVGPNGRSDNPRELWSVTLG
ncbi:hypothetical protein GCM10009745_59550 [Kribbella yunnanensis]|uniref:TauD/TfdA-like domain-containing protein n=1 Tax=Kribbella yunnanensis TaxID=190194 RepID=A0ABP4UGM2_9ACTN